MRDSCDAEGITADYITKHEHFERGASAKKNPNNTAKDTIHTRSAHKVLRCVFAAGALVCTQLIVNVGSGLVT